MKIKRVITNNEELEKKINSAQAHAVTWSNIWRAKESNQYAYNKMIGYQLLEEHYKIQLEKRLETVEEKKLYNLCRDLNVATDKYLSRHCFFSPAAERLQSIKRISDHNQATLQERTLPTHKKLLEIQGFLLKEFNETEQSHNSNLFSRQFTKSHYAATLMSVFEENGIDPNDERLKTKANEFNTDNTDNSCIPFFPLKMI